MSSIFLALSCLLVLSLCEAVCTTANIKVKWYNVIIGSLIIYFCFLFSYVLSADTFYVLIVCMFSCLFNSFFYTNYQLSTKNIIIFLLFVAYILFIEGIKFEAQQLFKDVTIGTLNIIIVIFSIFLLLIISLLFRFCLRRAKISNYIMECKIYFIDKVYELELYLDSGNFLKFGEEKLPVVIVSKNKIKNSSNCDGEMVLSGVASKEANIPVYIPTKFEIKIKGRWVEKRVALGIVDKDFIHYDGLIGLECIN